MAENTDGDSNPNKEDQILDAIISDTNQSLLDNTTESATVPNIENQVQQNNEQLQNSDTSNENSQNPHNGNEPNDNENPNITEIQNQMTNIINQISDAIGGNSSAANETKNIAEDPNIMDDSLVKPFADIVSKITIIDGSEENEQIPQDTFSMTEATSAKPASAILVDETNEIEQSKPKPRPSKRKQVVEDDEDDEVQYTDEQLQEAYEEFKKTKALPTYLMRDSLLEYARRQSLQFMVNEDYDAAYQNDLSVNDLLLEYSKDSGGYTTETITRNLEARIQEAQKQRQLANEKYKQKIAQLKENEQKKLDQLVEEHEQERRHFEYSCQQPEFIQRFSKPSKKLLQMRRIQKSLALAHKFEEAKEVKIEADQLQKHETVEAKRNAVYCIKKSYATLLEKQNLQLECAKENADRKVRALEEKLEKENSINRLLTRQLELKLKETKSKKPCSLPPLNANGAKKAPSRSTLKQMAVFKSTQQVSQLNVRLNNIQKIVGTMRLSFTKPVKIV